MGLRGPLPGQMLPPNGELIAGIGQNHAGFQKLLVEWPWQQLNL